MILSPKTAAALTAEQQSFLNTFFARCPESLCARMIFQKYPKNHTLISADDTCAYVYILLAGRLQAVEEHVADEPYSFTELSAIEVVGDFELFTGLPSRVITLTTLERSACMVLPAADYLTWIKSDANALFLRTQMLIRQLIAQTRFDRENFFLDNRTRFLHFLSSECRRQTEGIFPVRIPYTRPEIACRLGCSVRTVNRTVQTLYSENVLSLRRGKIELTEGQCRMIQKMLDDRDAGL